MTIAREAAQAEAARAISTYRRGDGYCISGQEPVFAGGPVIVSGIRTTPETDAQRIARLSQEVGRLQAERDQLAQQLEYRTRGETDPEVELRYTMVDVDGGQMRVGYVPRYQQFAPTVEEVWVGCEWWSVDWLKPVLVNQLQRALEAKKS
jgi:hypothetical protein